MTISKDAYERLWEGKVRREPPTALEQANEWAKKAEGYEFTGDRRRAKWARECEKNWLVKAEADAALQAGKQT